MKLFLKLLAIFAFAVNFIACDSSSDPDDNDPPVVTDESIAEKISHEYDGSDISFDFSNGTDIKIVAENNTTQAHGNITISQIENERYFNSKNHLTFDFGEITSLYNFEFKHTLPEALVEEDIVMILYSPDNSNSEMKALEIDFVYNAGTGEITSAFAAPEEVVSGKTDQTQGGTKYTRLVISWSDRQALSEKPQEKIVNMPYYEQPGGSCWATAATMYSRGYTSDKKKEIRIIDFLKYMEHTTLDEGMGLYDFKMYLSAAIKKFSGVNTKTSTFVSKSNLLDEIITKLDEDKPVILNMDYPGVGGHAVLVVGYQIDLVSAGKISIKLLLHNPRNISGESMHQWADFDWLMSEKSLTEAFQILYSDKAVPSSRPLQTIGMPIDQQFGKLEFIIRSKDDKEYSIHLSYKESAENGYVWAFPNTDECEIIPDSVNRIDFKLPVYNTESAAKNLTANVKFYNNENDKLLYEDSRTKSFSNGTGYFEGELSMSFVDASVILDARVEIELLDGGNFLDGYTLNFKVAPKLEKEIVFMLSMLGTIKTINPDGYSTSEDVILFGAKKMTLTGSGKKFTGTSYEDAYGMKTTKNVELEFDKDVNPGKISLLSVEMINEVYYSGTLVGTQFNDIELRDIEIRSSDKVGTSLQIERNGTSICGYINSVDYNYTPEDDEGSSTVLTDHRCDNESYFTISLK